MRTYYYPTSYKNKEFESNLNDFRLSAGMTIKEVCDKVNIATSEYCALNNGTVSPIYIHSGRIKPIAEKLAALFNTTLFDLFPRYFCTLPQNKFHNEDIIYHFHRSCFDASFQDPERILEQKEVSKIIKHSISKVLSKNDIIVLREYLNDVSYQDIASKYDTTITRVKKRLQSIYSRLYLYWYRNKLLYPIL